MIRLTSSQSQRFYQLRDELGSLSGEERNQKLADLRHQEPHIAELLVYHFGVAPLQLDLSPGFCCGDCTIIETLGAGGCGLIYRAKQEIGGHSRVVAVKIVQPANSSPEYLDQFQREIRHLIDLSSKGLPGIVQILSAGRVQIPGHGTELPYFVMQFIDGQPLDSFCRRLDIRERIETFVAVCDAVQTAHNDAVLHLDLKPANILVTREGQPVILDFGLAEHFSPYVPARSSGGTLPHMAPEQLDCELGELGFKTDVYSLGVLLFQLLTDEFPYRLRNRSEVEYVRCITGGRRCRRRLCQVRTDLPPALETIVDQALALRPRDRIQSAAALARLLRDWLRRDAGFGTTDVGLLEAYIRAARALWDIIDLAGLPEDDRHIPIKRFGHRQLYVPLRLIVESTFDDTAVDTIEDCREQQRLAAAGRLATVPKRLANRQSLGDWLAPDTTRDGNRLVILGDPGSGKTTLMRWLATALLLQTKNDSELEKLPDVESLPKLDLLPILIRCRHLDHTRVDNCALDDLLKQAVTNLHLPADQINLLVPLLRKKLETERAILLVDGLDEITDPRLRSAFCERIEDFAKLFPRAFIFVTSRIVGYREMHRRLGNGFAHSTVAEFSDYEKHAFIHRWCAATVIDPGRRDVEAEKLRRSVHSNKGIDRLASNPMLLTTLALVQRKIGKLPNRRHKLYWEAVGVLLNWRSEFEDPLDPDEALPQLEYLAYAMCDRGIQRLPRSDVLELLEAIRRDHPSLWAVRRKASKEFLSELERRTGLLMEVGEVIHSGRPEPVYEFRHLTFQEYLAARALVEGHFPHHKPGTMLAKRVEPLAGRLVVARSRSGGEESFVTENWREALRLCVASCHNDDVDSVLRVILEPRRSTEARARAIEAALCLADDPNVTQSVAEEILRSFSQLIDQRDGHGDVRTGIDHAAIEVAGSSWGERLQEWCVREFMRRSAEERMSAGGVAGMVAGAMMPYAEPDRIEWMKVQTKRLASQNQLEATGAALAVMQAALEGKAVLISALVDGLIALIGRGRTAAEAGAWALYYLAATRPDAALHKRWPGIWRPTVAQFSPLIHSLSNWELSHFTLQCLVSVAGIGSISEATDNCLRLTHHGYVDVRVAAIEALGRMRVDPSKARLFECLMDDHLLVRGAALSSLVRSTADQANLRLISFHLDGDRPWWDPAQPITDTRVLVASVALGLSEASVRGRYADLAASYGLKIGW